MSVRVVNTAFTSDETDQTEGCCLVCSRTRVTGLRTSVAPLDRSRSAQFFWVSWFIVGL